MNSLLWQLDNIFRLYGLLDWSVIHELTSLIGHVKGFLFGYVAMDEPFKPQILGKFFLKTHEFLKGHTLMQFDLLLCWPVPDSSFPENSQSLLVWLSQHLILIFSKHFRLQNVKVFLIASKIFEFSEHKREICQIFFRIEGLPTELKTVHINGEIRLNTSDQSHVVILTQIVSKHSGPNGCQDLALCGFWEITIGGLDLYGRDNSWLIKCIVLLEENLGAIFVLDQLGYR